MNKDILKTLKQLTPEKLDIIHGKSEIDKELYMSAQSSVIDSKKQAFAARYVSSDGKVKPSLQGPYVLALHFDLIPEKLKSKTVNHLIELIKKNGYRLDTGFVSVPEMGKIKGGSFLQNHYVRYGHKSKLISHKSAIQN